jgi:cell division protein FtsN
MTLKQPPPKKQRGRMVSFIIGLLLGLALAATAALYVSGMTNMFKDKVPQRTPEQNAAEIEKNKSWNPNGSLHGRNPAPQPSSSASNASKEDKPTREARNPADILNDQNDPSNAQGAASKPVVETFKSYFVQTGAYSNADEAEEQVAQLALKGLSAKIAERMQNGQTLYRVRLGPFTTEKEATQTQEDLDAQGFSNTLVRIKK